MKSRQELIAKLHIIDEELDQKKINISLVIVGSSALVLDNVIEKRVTNINFINPIESSKVLDALGFINAKYKQNGISLSNNVRIFQELFYGYEKNYKMLLGVDYKFKRLQVSIPVLELLLAAQCFNKSTSTDLLDIGTSYKDIDKDRFEDFVMNIWTHCSVISKHKLIALIPQIERLYYARKWNFDASVIKRLAQSFSNF